MAKVMIEMAHPSTYIEEVFKCAIENKVKTISFADDELEYIYRRLKQGRANQNKQDEEFLAHQEEVKKVKAEAINDFVNAICDCCHKCTDECPFHKDGCQIVRMAEKVVKEQEGEQK